MTIAWQVCPLVLSWFQLEFHRCVVSATPHAELPLRADEIAPIFLSATLPLRVLSSKAFSSPRSSSWIWARASRSGVVLT